MNRIERSRQLFIWVIAFLLFGYAVMVVVSSVILYQKVVSPEARHESLLYAPDDSLGFRAIPYSTGNLILYAGDTVPIRFNGRGHRVPFVDSTSTLPDSVDILYLGCSFTFGYACRAEDTYPHLVSVANGLTYMNAATSAYGLSQMFILSERLIPLYRPRYVVFQRSSWLPYRGTDPFNRVDQGLLTTPYFSGDEEAPVLRYPIAESLVFELLAKHAKEELDTSLLPFIFRFGIQHILKEHYMYLASKLRMLLNPDLRPNSNVYKLEQAIYQRMSDLAIANGSIPIVLSVGYRWDDATALQLNKEHGLPILINADSVLVGRLPPFAREQLSPDAYNRAYDCAYSHWQVAGTDSVLIDTHPNEKAHALVAEAILAKVPF